MHPFIIQNLFKCADNLRMRGVYLSMGIPVRVIPNASRSRVAGEQDGFLKVYIKAVPEKGKANKELMDVLARHFGRKVEIVRGQTSRKKIVRLI
jgi:uncharacterized protein (TIGR00251 family)